MTDYDLQEFIQDIQALLAPGHNDYTPEFRSGVYFALDALQYRMKEKKMFIFEDKNTTNSLQHVKCPVCEGYGRVCDPDSMDPIEGSKMATYYKCPFCLGSGAILSTSRYYQPLLHFWDELRRLESKEELKKTALSKLTKEEREALGY